MSSVLVFSDIHFGENLNSPIKLDIAANNIDWIIETIQENKIKTVIFCGDWFHSRNSISVNTFFKSYQALTKLTAYIDKLYMIVGNHDSYYKNTIDIHSLKSFEQIPNVQVIDKLTKIRLDDKQMVLVPWGFSLSDIKKFCEEKIDYLFGHFEPNGAELCGAISQGCNYGMEDLTQIAPLVFSGHYHISKEYPNQFGKVIMVGSPSQQNWGDIETRRGCYILNVSTGNSKFIENIKAPVHNKFLYSQILETKKLPKKEKIENNFIKLIVDCPYKYSQINNLMSKFHQAHPLTLEPEYYYSDQIKLDLLNNGNTVKSFKTYAEYIIDYFNSPLIEIPKDIDKEKLQNLALSVYNKASSENE